MCLPHNVDELSSAISLLLGRSGFESGFAFVGKAWTNYKAVGADLCHSVPFHVIPLIETLLSLDMVI